MCVQDVVILWSSCGESRGKRGLLTVAFLCRGLRQLFQLYFSGMVGRVMCWSWVFWKSVGSLSLKPGSGRGRCGRSLWDDK